MNVNKQFNNNCKPLENQSILRFVSSIIKLIPKCFTAEGILTNELSIVLFFKLLLFLFGEVPNGLAIPLRIDVLMLSKNFSE